MWLYDVVFVVHLHRKSPLAGCLADDGYRLRDSGGILAMHVHRLYCPEMPVQDAYYAESNFDPAAAAKSDLQQAARDAVVSRSWAQISELCAPDERGITASMVSRMRF